MRTLIASVAATLVLAPAAGAWTKLTGDTLQNIVDPSVLVLSDGTELIAYREPVAGNLKLIRNGSTTTLASGLAIVGDAVLAPGSGVIYLFGSGPSGVVRYQSSDGGASWSGPAAAMSKDVGDVQAAAVRPGGPPLYSQDGTGFLNVFQGAGSEVVHNLFPHCCAYAESLAVDSTGQAQIAFWSNATGQSDFLYGALDGTGALIGGELKRLGSGQTIPRDDRVPLVADANGNTFAAYSEGYPTSTSFHVVRLQGRRVTSSLVLGRGTFVGGEPHMALSVDASDRLWAVWTQSGVVWAARSRSHGAHFGASVHVAGPGTVYQLEAGARPDGSVDVVANAGSNLQLQRLLPGLTAVASGGFARVTDDGFPVAGATLKGGGRTLHTNAAGRARLAGIKRKTTVSVTASGYAATSLRTP